MLRQIVVDIALLLLRVGAGGLMIFGHGLDKLLHFSDKAAAFPDPLGVGHTTSLALAVFAEFFCSVLLILGLGTRLAALPLLVTMLMAAIVIHGADPWQKKELAAVYAVMFAALLVGGGGRLSFDHLIWPRLGKRKKGG